MYLFFKNPNEDIWQNIAKNPEIYIFLFLVLIGIVVIVRNTGQNDEKVGNDGTIEKGEIKVENGTKRNGGNGETQVENDDVTLQKGVTVVPGKLILPDHSEIIINEDKLFGRDDFTKNFPEKCKYISREHFKILSDNGKYYVEDDKSSGGTKVNGIEIKNMGKQLLNKGDKILLADSLELIFLQGGT